MTSFLYLCIMNYALRIKKYHNKDYIFQFTTFNFPFILAPLKKSAIGIAFLPAC